MIYLGLLISCVFLLFLEQVKGTDKAKPYMVIGFVAFLILFIGLRYDIGPDYGSYKSIYTYPEEQRPMEPFFRIVMFLFNKVKLNYNIFLLFIAALSIGIKAYSISRYSPYVFLSLLIALPVSILGDMGQIRFSLAMATLWLSIPFCLNRNLLKFLLIVLLAGFMHYSALIFIPIYWISTKKINFYAILGIWAICYLLSFRTEVGDIFQRFLENLGIVEFSSKSNLYVGEEVENSRYGVSFFGLLSKILVLVMICFSSMENERLKRLYVMIYTVGGCFFFLFSSVEILGTRFSLYYFSFEALMVPMAIYSMKDIKLHYLMILLFIIKSTYQFITMVYLNYPDFYLPYRNILQLF